MKFLLTLSIFLSISFQARASCDVIWHPGDLIFVDAGHSINIVMDIDDLAEYMKRKVPDNHVLPTDESLNKMLKEGKHAWYCGDFREITDADVYGEDDGGQN